jgi:hypothetical protein
MSTATIPSDKQPRKQLSDQLDRLDAIIDALGEGLNGAVADAAREGTRLAVKDAVVEMMTDPALRARLHQATAPEPEAEPAAPRRRPGFWAWLTARAGQALKSLARKVVDLAASALSGARAVVATAVDAVRGGLGLSGLTKVAVAGLSAGVAAGAARYLAPQAVAAALSGVRGAVTAAAARVGAWTRRAARALSLV